jgi:DNA-binding MarR family transcriptional regulator
MSRRPAIHRDLDRAGYLLARTLVADGPGRITDLADRLGLDPTTVTRQVATMEAAGLVRRRRDPHDARVSMIELAALGRRRMQEVQAAREARVGQLVESWTPADRRAFGDLLARFNAAIRERNA